MSDLLTLRTQELSVRYGKLPVVHDTSLEFRQGKVTAITGPNGAGKSSLLLGIRGTVQTGGNVYLNDQDLADFSPRERARTVALVPQGRQLFPRMTVRENLQVMADLLGLPHSSVDRGLDRFPVLRERSRSLAGVLSGGEQQMLTVSRALLEDPQFLLMDEPMTGLAPLVVQAINRTIRELADSGVGIIIAEPAVRALKAVIDEGHVIIRGRVAASTTSFMELESQYQAIMGMAERASINLKSITE